MRLVVDTSYVNVLCHPGLDLEFYQWVERRRKEEPNFVVMLPDIVDYEVRRGFYWRIRQHEKRKDLSNLNKVRKFLSQLDLLPRTQVKALATTKGVLDKAAELWGVARSKGQSSSLPERIDIDVIIASHAIVEDAEVATKNTKHITAYGAKIVQLR